MRTILVMLAVLIALCGVATAADDILALKNGRLVVGKIKTVDKKGVTIVSESGEAKYDWASLTPRCQYEVRSDRIAEKDADGHAALAQFCLDHRLYAEARTEANVAKALGYRNKKALAAFQEDVNRSEADATFAKIEQLVAEEEFDKAREEIRRFLMQAPPSDYTEKARGMVADLIRRRDSQILREAEEEKTNRDLEKRKKLNEKLKKLETDVKAARDEANTAFIEAVRYHEIGNVTRARKGYEATERALFKAHVLLRRIQRIVRRGPTYDKAEAQKEKLREKLVEVYLGLARLYVKDRNFKRGMPFVNKVLYLDPVNKEALDLRAEVEEKWLKTSARRLTNTPGVRVTGPTGR